MRASKFQPALLGGLVLGVLSALPIINLGNTCCCLWVIAGGMTAAYLLQNAQVAPITSGDGAAVGFLAGVAGAIVWLLGDEASYINGTVIDILTNESYTLVARFSESLPAVTNAFTFRINGVDQPRSAYYFNDEQAGDLMNEVRYSWSDINSGSRTIEVFYSHGATEAKVPELMDALVDLTETGSTLRQNGLRIVDVILESTTRLLANRAGHLTFRLPAA